LVLGFQGLVFLGGLVLLLAGLTGWFDVLGLIRFWLWARKDNQASTGPIELVFTESTAGYSSKTATVNLSWAGVTRVLESTEACLLVLDSEQYWLISKRLFTDTTGLDKFRELLEQKVGIIG
jgi:hypothetical protein